MLTKSMLKKRFTLECDHCGAVNTTDLNYLTCQNPACGYQMKPQDSHITNLFGRAVQVIDSLFAGQVFETGVLPVDQMGATVIDESKWNWRWDSVNQIWIPPDYDKFKTTDGISIIKKASQGLWVDPTWEPGQGLIINHEIGLGGYHYMDVAQEAVQSARYFANQALALPSAFIYGTDNFPQWWLDCESNRGSGSVTLTPAQMENYIRIFVTEFQQASGYPLGIYTRSIWWDDYVARNAWAHSHALWIARYNPYISEPGEPLDWKNYGEKPILWQWSADGNGEGYSYGYHSNSIDKNRSPLLTTAEIELIVYGSPGNPPPGLPVELLIQDPATGEQQRYRQVS